MKDLQAMAILGIIAAMVAIFWTRIIKKNMIFRKIGKALERYNNNHIIMFKEDSLMVKFLRCCFCIQVWVSLLLCFWYIVEYRPPFILAFIGIFAALGAGNTLCEIIVALRNEGE